MAGGSDDFAGKVVLVTGGASGIGLAATKIFAGRGAAVGIADIDAAGGQAAAAAINDAGGRALFVETDVTDEPAVKHLVDTVVSELGGLHCAFNNAAYGGRMVPFEQSTLAEWNRVITISLTSVYLCMKHEIAHMMGAGGGAIVNTSSGAGIVGCPRFEAYSAAKHGVLGLTKSAAMEFARSNIRINAICPGHTDTPMQAQLTDGDPELKEWIMSTTTTGRMANPAEVAAAAVWLCSKEASFVSGDSMMVDMGIVCR
ncbi:short chain dehydrogenase [Sphingobium sp. BS19]|nr:short chain dehydrogenase [Sphingobium sp. BS19]